MTEHDVEVLVLIIWLAVALAFFTLIITSYWSNRDFSIWRCNGDAMEMEVAPCTLR